MIKTNNFDRMFTVAERGEISRETTVAPTARFVVAVVVA